MLSKVLPRIAQDAGTLCDHLTGSGTVWAACDTCLREPCSPARRSRVLCPCGLLAAHSVIRQTLLKALIARQCLGTRHPERRSFNGRVSFWHGLVLRRHRDICRRIALVSLEAPGPFPLVCEMSFIGSDAVCAASTSQ